MKTNRSQLGALTSAALLCLLVPASAHAATTDLGVDVADSPDPVVEDAQLTYTVAVTNSGPDGSANAVVTDELSSHVDFVSASPTQGNCAHNGKRVVCRLGELALDGAATASITVIPRKPGTITNTATVDVAAADTDPVAANDSETESTTVIAAGGGGSGVTCGGRPATIVGTGAAETLTGTSQRDVIKARGGNDVIRGLEVGDVVCAGGGDDILRGGGGNDRLRGGAGRDRLKGGVGADALDGGTGRDRCRGGGGPDTKVSC
jgi:uncharacterized repeat protein (TIGR01451 family)